MRFAARALLPLLLATAGPAPPGMAATGEAVRDEARSTVEIRAEGDGILTHSVNRSFRVVTLHPPGAPRARTLLLAEEEEVVRSTVEEGPRSAVVRVEVSDIDDPGRPPLFRIEADGEAGAVVDIGGSPLYQVTRHGCCGARDSVSTWSLVSGFRLFSATAPVAFFDVPNSGGIVRLVAVHAAWSIDDAEAFGGRQDVAALIAYASPSAPLRRVLVTVRPPAMVDAMMGDPRPMLLVDGASDPVPSATLWRSDGRRDRAAVAGLAVTVAFTPGNEVTIPIVGDDLDLAHATVSPALALEAIPLDPGPASCSCRRPRPLFPAAEEGDSSP